MWLDPARTSPYQFRQFWVQFDDAMVGTYLKMLSMRPLDEIEPLLAEQAAAPGAAAAQRALADEMTDAGARPAGGRRSPEAAEVLFGGDPTRRRARRARVVAAEVPLRRAPERARRRAGARAARRRRLGQVEQRGQPAARPGRGPCRKSGARHATACSAHQTCSAGSSCCFARASATTSSENV